MYLSRLILNPTNRRVQRELANLYELHRSLMRAFPENLPTYERVLFRVDMDERTGIPTVLLQSHLQPDWAWLDTPGARGYLLRPPESKPFELNLVAGQKLAFRLRANPTVKHSQPNQRQGRRDPLYKEDAQIAWLERKGQAGGFCPIQIRIIREGNLYGMQPAQTANKAQDAPRAHRLVLYAVRFEGVLQVTDPVRLWETVQQGIGPGKGLGLGLLSLARI